MKYVALLSLPLLLLLVSAEEKEAKCPVSGKPASKDHTLNVNGKTIAFCCDKCPVQYKKDLNLSADAATKCPKDGEPAKKETAIIEKTAEQVAFCCDKCPKTFLEKNKLTAKDDGPKTCPVSGKPAKNGEGTSLNINGKKVYFCCDNCPKTYLKGLGIAADAKIGNCPVSGKPAKAETAMVLVKSKEVAFCCSNCQKEYVEKNFKDGVKIASPAK